MRLLWIVSTSLKDEPGSPWACSGELIKDGALDKWVITGPGQEGRHLQVFCRLSEPWVVDAARLLEGLQSLLVCKARGEPHEPVHMPHDNRRRGPCLGASKQGEKTMYQQPWCTFMRA